MPGRQEPGLRLARTISRPSDREDGDAVREDHHPDDIRATIHTPHSGEVPRDEPTDIIVTNAAKRLGVTRVAPSRLERFRRCPRGHDLRLSKALGTTPGPGQGMPGDFFHVSQ